MEEIQGTQTMASRLHEEIAAIQRARTAQAHNRQFVALCNRSIERLREYANVMARTQDCARQARLGRR